MTIPATIQVSAGITTMRRAACLSRKVGPLSQGAVKVRSVSGALTVTFTGPAGNTPTVYSDGALTVTVSLPATVSDGTARTFHFASAGNYLLSVQTAGTEIGNDANTTRPVEVEFGHVQSFSYDTRLLAPISGTDTVRAPAGGNGGGGVSSLPSQTGNTGKYLTTDGSAASWGALGSAATHPASDFDTAGAASAVQALAALKANNLSDLPNAGTARTNLGLGSAATNATGDFDTAGAAAAAQTAAQTFATSAIATQHTTDNGTYVSFNVYTGGAYPARPGSTIVIWVGPSDPGGSANTNDLWVNTT